MHGPARSRSVILLLSGALLGVMFTGPAGAHLGSFRHLKKHFYTKAATNARYQLRPTATQTLSIPGNGLIDLNPGTVRNNNSITAPAYRFCTQYGVGPNGAAVLPLALPNGSVLTGLAVGYTVGGSGSQGSIVVNGQATGSGAGLSTLSILSVDLPPTSGLAGGSDTTPSFSAAAIVDTTARAYSAQLYATGDPTICSIEVTYTVPKGFSGA